MLSKCANPSCATLFHRYNEGRLFRLNTSLKHGEVFWLCGPCSASYILVADEHGKPHLRHKPKPKSRANQEGSASMGPPPAGTAGDVAKRRRRSGRSRNWPT
jgi:hypothetical protein